LRSCCSGDAAVQADEGEALALVSSRVAVVALLERGQLHGPRGVEEEIGCGGSSAPLASGGSPRLE